jgi:pyruvate,water dikinase
VTTVGGRVAVDLELLDTAPVRAPLARALDPRRPARRVLAGWRVGRLRTLLPTDVAETLRRVDGALVGVPVLETLAYRRLVDLLRRLGDELIALHAREVLAGMLVRGDDRAGTAAGVALVELAEGRAAGRSDARILERRPVVLALTPPRIGGHARLPATATGPVTGGATIAGLGAREALRLRARWLQELGARAATELGQRLAVSGRLPDGDPALVAYLSLDEAARLAEQGTSPSRDELRARATISAGPPLPAAFRLTAAGDVVVVGKATAGAGRAAGGGRGVGRVSHDPTALGSEGGVLVVETLSPDLAAVLDGLAGLVSETGSMLSHLAILAREFRVPTVVGVANARQRFPEGTRVVVDGATGEVSLVTKADGEDP